MRSSNRHISICSTSRELCCSSRMCMKSRGCTEQAARGSGAWHHHNTTTVLPHNAWPLPGSCWGRTAAACASDFAAAPSRPPGCWPPRAPQHWIAGGEARIWGGLHGHRCCWGLPCAPTQPAGRLGRTCSVQDSERASIRSKRNACMLLWTADPAGCKAGMYLQCT